MKAKTLIIAGVAASFLAQPVLAEGLAPGRPAGVHKALGGNGLLAVGVGVAIVAGVAVAIASSNSAPAAPVTPPVSPSTT